MNRIKESININLLLLSISLGSFITAILIIISPVSKIHLPKTLKLFLRIILTTSIDNLIRATILMLIGVHTGYKMLENTELKLSVFQHFFILVSY